MLKGYIKSAEARGEISMAVTGGYDSRILFLASLDSKCNYFVHQHPSMGSNHYDITIPKKLTQIYNKKFLIVKDENINDKVLIETYKKSIDHPRFLNLIVHPFPNSTTINGNISEVARNYFGDQKNISGEYLAEISGHAKINWVIDIYNTWLRESNQCFEFGYHPLDLFYWEEKMGNWAAKSKTESNIFNQNIFSPFNSRELLIELLSTDRKLRDSHFNKLYNEIIKYLSNGRNGINKIPINPSKKQFIIRILKRLKIYNLYSKLKNKAGYN